MSDNQRMANIMPRIPGEYLAKGSHGLPDAGASTDLTAVGYSDVPGIGRVRITYQRMSSRKGTFRHWFWTPHGAELAE